MTHQKIRIPLDTAMEIMLALGNLRNSIEFEDLTKDDLEAKKNFAEMIKRCEEMKKKITDYTRICFDFHLPFFYYKSFSDFNYDLKEDMKLRDKKFGSTYFDLIENEISENDKRIHELVDSHSQIREDLVNLIEKKHVLLKAAELVRTSADFGNFSEVDSGENFIKQSASNLNFMAGVVNAENEMKMKRMIFRISRGRAVTTFYSLEINNDEYLLTTSVRQRGMSLADKESMKKEIGRLEKLSSLIQSKDVGMMNTKKKIFTVIFTGGEENILLQKLLKVCEVFQASRYPVPRNSEVNNEIEKIQKEIDDKKNLLVNIEKNLNEFFATSNTLNNKRGIKYSLYKLFFEEEKLVYTTLNKCILRETFVDGQVWIPKEMLNKVNNVLQDLFQGQENKLSAHLEEIPQNEETKPPTYIATNSFTEVFQTVVDTYGIPRYQEINPGYFTIVTFPFLFGVMFGDIGHGFILLVFSIYLCLFNDKISKEKSMLKGILFARYFLLLMGFFAVYCGLLYNDFLSIPVYFSSCYYADYNSTNTTNFTDYFTDNSTDNSTNDTPLPVLNKTKGCTYSFGLDPVWYIASNELLYTNSLKMKLSVILGVVQMVLGIVLKGVNSIFEKNFIEFIFVFIPQLILMLALFGYMDFFIIVKWNTNYDNKEYLAPDIKTFLMNIVLHLGDLPDVQQKSTGEKEDWILFTDRNTLVLIHRIILLVSFLCIILMLIPKIFINYFKAKNKYALNNNAQNIMNSDEQQRFNEDLLQRPQREIIEPHISDFIVETGIETIEFVLGTVSNTASYLRLWALSLAHSQLSVVFFSKLLCLFNVNNELANAIGLVFMFLIFAGSTFIVLLFMDMMECFLHTLRLHWVEFQNKFFFADGYKFEPFCFEQCLLLEDEELKEQA